MKRLSDRERVAYHEAGHAVMCYELHLPFKRVSIVPDAESAGRVHPHDPPPGFRPDCETDLRTEQRIKHQVMALLAGSLAENLAARPGPQRWAEGDSDNALSFATYVTGSGEEASAYVRWLWERTKLYLSRPWVWAEVKALVAALLEHDDLSGPRARRVIKEGLRAWRDAEGAGGNKPGVLGPNV